MPLYKFQCHGCGLRFEARADVASSTDPYPCLSCGTPAERTVPDTMTSTYNPTGDGSIRPQNTGVNSYDANVDRVIGSHAKTSYLYSVLYVNHQDTVVILQSFFQIEYFESQVNLIGCILLPYQDHLFE